MRKLKITELNRISTEEFKTVEKLPLIVVLDHVRSLYNVGSVFRSSDAFRVASVYLCGITATPPQVEIHKTALGAEDSVNWVYYERTQDAVEHLKAEGYEVWAVEQVEGSIMLQQEVVDQCDGCIEIPQFGTKHSLNVSVTAGILVWEFARKMKL